MSSLLPLYLAVIDNGSVQWLGGRASDSRLRGPGFGSCAAEFKNLGHVFFTLHCSSSLSCINKYLAIAVVDMHTNRLCTLIVAYGWMLPREVEKVFD